MRREMPLKILKKDIREFRKTIQQIANIMALRLLTDQEQEYIYWAVLKLNL